MFGWSMKAVVLHANSLSKNNTALSLHFLILGLSGRSSDSFDNDVDICGGTHKVTVILVFSSLLLIRNRSPGEQQALEHSAFFQGNVLNYLLIFLQSKQNGRFKEYA